MCLPSKKRYENNVTQLNCKARGAAQIARRARPPVKWTGRSRQCHSKTHPWRRAFRRVTPASSFPAEERVLSQARAHQEELRSPGLVCLAAKWWLQCRTRRSWPAEGKGECPASQRRCRSVRFVFWRQLSVRGETCKCGRSALFPPTKATCIEMEHERDSACKRTPACLKRRPSVLSQTLLTVCYLTCPRSSASGKSRTMHRRAALRWSTNRHVRLRTAKRRE